MTYQTPHNHSIASAKRRHFFSLWSFHSFSFAHSHLSTDYMNHDHSRDDHSQSNSLLMENIVRYDLVKSSKIYNSNYMPAKFGCVSISHSLCGWKVNEAYIRQQFTSKWFVRDSSMVLGNFLKWCSRFSIYLSVDSFLYGFYGNHFRCAPVRKSIVSYVFLVHSKLSLDLCVLNLAAVTHIQLGRTNWFIHQNEQFGILKKMWKNLKLNCV